MTGGEGAGGFGNTAKGVSGYSEKFGNAARGVPACGMTAEDGVWV